MKPSRVWVVVLVLALVVMAGSLKLQQQQINDLRIQLQAEEAVSRWGFKVLLRRVQNLETREGIRRD